MSKSTLARIVVLGWLFLFLAGCSKTTTPTDDKKVASDANSDAAEANRALTYLTSKQAYARLTLYLRDQGRSPLKALWKAIPERSLFFRETSYGMVGGWVFFYRGQDDKEYEARLVSDGEVNIEESDSGEKYLEAIQPGNWVLDNTDAHTIALSNGGRGKGNQIGGYLMTFPIEGKGVRPVWGGNTWLTSEEMPDKRKEIMIDAQTGELYHRYSEKAAPVSPGRKDVSEWDGGFDEQSEDARTRGSGDKYHDSWWPRAYKDLNGRFVYNRKLLATEIKAQSSRRNRPSSSWKTTGILSCALGNWTQAIDLSNALKIDPNNEECRYYRGMIYLIVRDFENATADFQTLSAEFRQRVGDPNLIVAMMKGRQSGKKLDSFIFSADTDEGRVPVEIWIGPLPLESMQQLRGRPQIN